MPESPHNLDLDRVLGKSRIVPGEQFTADMRRRLQHNLRGGEQPAASQNGRARPFAVFNRRTIPSREYHSMPSTRLIPAFGVGFVILLVAALGAAVMLPAMRQNTAQPTETPTGIASPTASPTAESAAIIATPSITSTPGGITVTSRATAAAQPMPVVTRNPVRTPVPPTATPASGEPMIHSLEVRPFEGLKQGDTITVAWSAEGTSAKVCLVSPNMYPGVCLFDQPVEGTTTFTIFHPVGLMYVDLVVQGNAVDSGAASEVTAQIVLDLGCPTPWVFDALQADNRCPGAAQSFSAAAQPFERGWMIWTGSTYYVLLDRPSPIVTGSNDLIITLDPLNVTGDTSANYTPPDGLYAPISGFGIVWRGDASNLGYSLVDGLGWATQPEYTYQTQMQCVTYTHRLTTCYLIHPNGSLVELGLSSYSGMYSWEHYSPE